MNTTQADKAMKSLGKGEVVDVRSSDAVPSSIGPARAQTVLRRVEWRSGKIDHIAASEISDGKMRFSVVSSASDEATAQKNMTTFLPIAMMTGLLRDAAAPR